jgi:hypothetical protein
MTGMLASVHNTGEAEQAMDADVDDHDLKDPDTGAMEETGTDAVEETDTEETGAETAPGAEEADGGAVTLFTRSAVAVHPIVAGL